MELNKELHTLEREIAPRRTPVTMSLLDRYLKEREQDNEKNKEE